MGFKELDTAITEYKKIYKDEVERKTEKLVNHGGKNRGIC